MKSFRRRRYGQAEALIDARNKAFNIVMAVLLVFTMLPVTAFTYESQASAEPLNNEQIDTYSDDGSSSNQDGDNGSSGGSSTGGNNATGGDNGTSGGSSSESGQGSGGSSDNGSSGGSNDGAGSNSGSSSDGNNASSGNGSQGNQNGSSDGNGTSDKGNNSDSSSNDDGDSDNSGTTDEKNDSTSSEDDDTNNDSKDPSESEDAEDQRDPFAWQSKLDACDLGAKLTVETSEIESLENDELPSTIPATFRVDFRLNPGEDKLLVDDWIKTTLPNFLTFENATYEVFRLNEDGTETTEKIADAKVENGKLKITFVEAGATEDTNAVVRGFVDLKATFNSALLGDDQELKQTWTAQTDEDGTENNIDVVFPTKQAVLDAWHAAHNIINDITGINKGEVEAQESANALSDGANAVVESTTTYQVSLNKQVSSTITWCDNNSDSRPSTASLESGFIPYYAVQGSEDYKPLLEKDAIGNWYITDEAMKELHLEDYVQQLSTLPLVDITQTATNTYEVLSHALPGSVATVVTSPTLDDDGNPTYNEAGEQIFHSTTTTEYFDWKLVDTNAYPGYVDGTSSQWDHQYKMLTTDIEFTVIGKIGTEALPDVFGSNEENDFQFGATIDNQDKGSVSIAQAVEAGDLKLNTSSDGKTCTITGTVPAYDENGYPIVYHIEYNGEQNTEDYYQPTYDNSASANHGSDTTATYVGGTMTLRHAGTTEYYGTKQWLDDGDTTKRPAVTFTLWRYSLNGGSAETASQVTLSQDASVSGGTSSNSAASYVQVTLPAGSSSTVDLHALLRNTYGDAIDQLPKYDPDGYPYVYALREEAISGYEQVFGSVAQDGTVNDTPPTYELPDGTWTSLNSNERPSNDHFVYNGGDNPNEGIVSNRITGTTSTEMTKSWEIAAFQDDLQEVVCEFTAQCRVKGTDGEWQKVDSSNAVQTLTGWNAETLTKSITGTFPRYDAHGKELEYRWVESNVTFNDQETNFVADGKGGGTFTINVLDAEGNPETLEFTSTPATTVGDDGSYSTQIVNTFENITDQHVDKYWEQPDGSLAQIAPDSAYDDGVAKVELYQDGVKIGEFTLDGKTDENATPIDGLGDATWQETSSYHGDFENLPKYSPDGVRYNYIVLEVKKDNWHSERTYDSDTRTTRIDNYFPEGEGSEIRVTKYWLDGDDAAHRLKVRAQLVAKHYMKSNATNVDGTPRYEYNEGEAVEWIDDDGVLHDTIDLTSSELWFAEIDVPIGGLTYKDFEVREIALVDDKGTETTDDDTVYEVLTRNEAEDQYADEAWVNAAWTNPDNKRVATEQHVYEVKTRYNESMQSCEITNRRLGLLDITVSKEWKDGLGADEDKTRPEATLTLSCLEYDNAFLLNDEGNLQVSVSGNTLEITDANGKPVKATIVNDADGDGRGSAQVTVDTTKATSDYVFEGLPKYDADGLNVHYTVEEDWKADAGDYRSSKTKDEYTVIPNKRHFQDEQDIDFTNSRSGVRDVVFYKEWHDAYVNDTLKQRPDIYLTLWQVSGNNEPKQVDGYVHFLWEAAGEGGDATNNQKVTISDLPKYDSDGYEITYYATESMSADGTSLGYAPGTFKYDNLTDVEERDRAIKVSETESDNPTQDGTGWAIHENGTFVNTLTGTLTAKGTKLWENIPGNVLQADLPEVTVYLQQKLANDAEWPDMYLQKDDSGNWVVKEGSAVAETSELTETATNQYTYTITEDYDGEELPRYDENGNLYEYRAVEVIWGLYNQTGGFTDKELDPEGDGTSINLTDIRDADGTNNPLNKHIFVIQHGETGSFLLRNIYSTHTDKGNLTVKKLFDGRDAADSIYPDVTYTVYRYYMTGEGKKSEAQAVASHTITQRDFQKSQEGAEGNRSATYTFENLEVYAPDGSYWIYYVTETDINGYETTVGIGDLQLDDNGLIEGTDANGATQSPDLGTFDQDGGITNSVIAEDEAVDVTFANKYNPESADLKGAKKWDDFNNIFSVRPTDLDLAFTRTAGGVTEDVKTQSNDENADNYLMWTAKGDTGDWTFELKNIEKWAPNGQAWTYTVTEDLSVDGTDEYYSVVTGSSSVSTNSTAQFRLENALRGQASVSKEWIDGGDPYGLRPETVTVELQARTKLADGSGDYSEWDDAYTVWKQFASDEQLDDVDLTQETIMRELSPDNGWKGSWRRLPVIASLNADSPRYNIEYRVVEVKIGDRDISNSVNMAVNPQDGKVYGEVHPYQPEQTEWTGDAQSGWATSISNTLETTKVTASKSWKGDDLNGTDDAWGTRPADGNSWTVTYFLQQRVQDGDWQWVVEAGSDAMPDGSASQDGVVSLTISNGLATDDNHEVVVNNDGSVTVTWKNLPECDENGTPYEYRVVEQVPGSYDVIGATEVEDTDTDHRYYVVAAAGDGSYAYENELRTVDLTGTKAWASDYAKVAFDEDKAPKMTLWRQVGNDTSTAEQVKMKGGSAAPQPKWNDDDGDGVWTFVYENLPAADENDEAYVYWAEEQVGSVDGWYPTYGTADAAGTEVDGGQQTGTQITNHPTLLNLAKVSDFAGDKVTLHNIELSVLSTDGKTTYAVWTNGADGETFSAKVWTGGTADPATDSNYVETDGSIEGLKAGKYIVRETGEVPEGYAQAKDVTFELKSDGTAVKTNGVDFDTANGVSTVEVTATDPVLRGHLELTKLVSDNGTVEADDVKALEGATFDLYRVDCDNDGKDELIAEDLTSDANGKVTTVGKSDVSISKWSSKGESGGVDLTYGGKYVNLSNGLPEGKYYFVETNATPGAVLPTGENAKSEILEITQDDHYATTKAPVKQSMGNEEFNATVELIKYDTTSLSGINGTEFSLEYRPEGSTDSGYPINLGTFTTQHDATLDKDGVLVLPDLKKGDYLLTETKNTGYDIEDENGFKATFTIDNNDDNRTFVVWQDDGKDIGFQVTSGKLDHGAGVPNTRQFGQVTLNKRGNNTAIDATFELQMKQADGTWSKVVDGLETGNSYELAFNDDGITATATDTGDLTVGQLKATGLTWNTYRFVEQSTAAGYLPENGNGPLTSSEFTINRDTQNMSAGVTVQNIQTDLRINKQSPTGEALNGAKFTVTPVDGSKFADNTTDAKTLTTENSGFATLKGQLIVGGTYEIYEVAGPSGYDPVDDSFRVFVENDGYLTVVDDQGQKADLPEGYARTDVDGTGTDAFSFIATNQPMAIKLIKVSSADSSLTLKGATFRLTGKVMFDNDSTHTYTTNEEGEINITEGLMGGVEYTLIEDQAPAGYITETAKPITFYMDDRGEIDVDGDLPEGWTVNGDKISFTATNEPVELQITKRAPDNEDGTEGKLLDGATFTVTPVGNTTFADGSPDSVEMVTESGTARITAQLMVGGTYDITETKAPDGFELVEGIMRVEVDEHGNINPIASVDDNGAVVGTLPPAGYSRADSDGDGTPDNAFEVKVVNQPIEILLVKVDRDDTMSRLPDATFEIVPQDDSKFADGTTAVKQFTTGDEGTLEVSEQLAYGNTYTIREIEAPYGFELIEDELTFSVAENGEISAVGDVPEGYGIETDGVTISASDEPIEVGFIKKDLGENVLAGAEFTLSGTFVNDETHKTEKLEIPFATTGNVFSFAGMNYDGKEYSLVAGETYTLTETTAPSGYELVDAFQFTVGTDGNIVEAGDSKQAAEGEEGFMISSDQNGAIVLTAHDTPIQVTLEKTSSTNSEVVLQNATFELYHGASVEEGVLHETLTTDENGLAEFKSLVGGETYTLHEVTAPAGYELLSDVTFTVEKDGTVTLQGAPEGYTVAEGEDGVVTFTAADTPIEAKLVKTDEASTPLANAIFTVQGTFAGDYANETEITLSATDANGVASIPSAALIANEKYTITEVTAPGGYELAGSVEFTVDTDGVISIVVDDATNAGATTDSAIVGVATAVDSSTTGEGSAAESVAMAGKNGTGTYTASTDGGTAVISATDHLVEVTITKTDGGQGLLPGAEFTATATGSNNGSPAGHSVTATTGEDGTAVLSGLIAGQEYTLTETKAPAGYELLTDTLTFTVQADGTIDAGFFPPAAFAIGQAKDAVTVTDNPLEVTLVKQAPNGAPLAGAEFRVEGEFPDGQTEKTFTSDENGIVFHQLQLTGSAEGTLYTVTETKAPEGYAQPSGSLDLLVFEHGTVQVADTSVADMKQNASVAESSGVAVITLNNEPLPGTELPQTGDNKILPLLAGAFGLLGLWAIVMGTVAYRRFRTKGEE